MTDHWLDTMPPIIRDHYGPADMPQQHPPIETNVEPLSYIEHVEPLTASCDMGDQVSGMTMEEKFKKGGIQTHGGGAQWPLAMDWTCIDIEDIAHSLAMKVRYTGHCIDQYSIAQHSCHVHDLVPEEDRREALMHDGSEYVLPDVAAPVKSDPDFRAFFKPIEKRVESSIAFRFGLRFPFPPSVKYADNQMAWFEKKMVMNPPKYPWMVWTIPVVEPIEIPNFRVWSWVEAKTNFMARARLLGLDK